MDDFQTPGDSPQTAQMPVCLWLEFSGERKGGIGREGERKRGVGAGEIHRQTMNTHVGYIIMDTSTRF